MAGNIRVRRGTCQRPNFDQYGTTLPADIAMPLNRLHKRADIAPAGKNPINANLAGKRPRRVLPPITAAPPPPPGGARARTWKLLMDTAGLMVQEGSVPTVAQLAERAGVSRATAYRYFPSRGALVAAMIDMALAPVRAWDTHEADGRARVHQLFKSTFPQFEAFEPHMRAAVQLSLEQYAQARAGQLHEPPYRRGHRIGILAHALAPFASVLPPERHERLHQALSLIYGVEPYIVFKDIWDMPQREVESLVFWMVEALLDAALRDAAQEAPDQAAQEASRDAAAADGARRRRSRAA